MTGRERIIHALTFKNIDKIPFEVPHSDKIKSLFESDVVSAPYKYGKGQKSGTEFAKGISFDEWGCKWEAGEDGVTGEVKDYIIKSWDDLKSFYPPYDVIEETDLSEVNDFCKNTDKFVINMWRPSAAPFQRMQYLRGTEQLFMDLAFDEEELYIFRDLVHSFYVHQVKKWCETSVDAIHIEDDWGTQLSMLISPKKWREFFKPLYKEYCDMAHSYGKYVVMHSDGMIIDIIDDLVEIGVNALNLQLFCFDMDELEHRFGGRVCFWGEVDRQYLLPFGTEDEIRAGVRKVAKTFLKNRKTGLVGMCFASKDIKDDSIIAVYDEFNKASKELF